MANKSDAREKDMQAKNAKRSGNSNVTQMRNDRNTREQHSSGMSGGRPDETMPDRSSGKGNHARSGDMGREVGVPSRQTSTASEEEGQL
ncbi:MAG TPA: hypothetical protein VG267_03820 [Terracidiphilus sp.]|jgi:hypothetical protein|nr:hypothetical protein [Terracidiphilus sp.]